jgi:flagellar biosynthesis anti-sigma factor FlgM
VRIEGNQSVQSISVYQQTKQSAPSGNKPSGTENARDEVNISQEAKALHQQTVRDVTSPERSERINQLMDAVQNGTYYVDARQVVEKMIQYWKSL